MQCTGKLDQIYVDYMRGRQLITFETDCDCRKEYDRLKGKDKLSIDIKEYREKRSLDANAYFHVLVGKIAEAMSISKARCKNILICRYGQVQYLDDDKEAIIKTNIPVSAMMEQEYLHCTPIGGKNENGQELTFYKIYRGSHTYNTAEMSYLIDGTVAEAKELGIETMTPDKIEEIKQKWGIRIG